LSANLHHGGHELRYHAIEDSSRVATRLDASLVPRDRTIFELAVRESIGNWIFHVPGTIAVLWLSTVIIDLALMTSLLLGALILISFVPAVVSMVLSVPRIFLRPFTKRGRNGYFWFIATTVMAVLDCAVYGVCLFLLARAAGFAPHLPV
jgi:hypothetical protein